MKNPKNYRIVEREVPVFRGYPANKTIFIPQKRFLFLMWDYIKDEDGTFVIFGNKYAAFDLLNQAKHYLDVLLNKKDLPKPKKEIIHNYRQLVIKDKILEI